MQNKINLIGKILLAVGVAVLILAIVFSFTIGTVLVPISFCTSIIVNTVAVMMIRYRGEQQ